MQKEVILIKEILRLKDVLEDGRNLYNIRVENYPSKHGEISYAFPDKKYINNKKNSGIEISWNINGDSFDDTALPYSVNRNTVVQKDENGFHFEDKYDNKVFTIYIY